MNVPIFGEYADVRLLAELAVEAEAAGWDGFWVWDHIHWSGENDGRTATADGRSGRGPEPDRRGHPAGADRTDGAAAGSAPALEGGPRADDARPSLGRPADASASGSVPRPAWSTATSGSRRRQGPGGPAGRGPRRADRAVDRPAVRLRRRALPPHRGRDAAATRAGPGPDLGRWRVADRPGPVPARGPIRRRAPDAVRGAAGRAAGGDPRPARLHRAVPQQRPAVRRRVRHSTPRATGARPTATW